MASMRRTLSPVPRPGARANWETCMMDKASPLSKTSSSPSSDAQYVLQPYGLFSFLKLPLYKMHIKKSQVWRRSLMHCIVFFLVGVLFGLAQFNSMNLSGNHMSTHSTFFFDMIPSVAKYQSVKFEMEHAMPVDGVELKRTEPLHGIFEAQRNVSIEKGQEKRELMDSGENAVSESLVDDPFKLQKLLIVITPTIGRPMQAYCLNRLAQTLKLVPPPLLWIVVEMTSQSAETADILRRSSIMYRHLVCDKNATELKDPYAHQRNVALSHIETHHLDGIIYFADDDNTYTADLFQQMRQISRFGTWKVAKLLSSGVLMGGPVCNVTEVIGWNTNEIGRRFHAEIPGFAFNSTILWDPRRWHRPVLGPIRQLDSMKETPMASAFIAQLVEDESQMECLPQNSSSILVWQLPHGASSQSYTRQWWTSDIANLTTPFV